MVVSVRSKVAIVHNRLQMCTNSQEGCVKGTQSLLEAPQKFASLPPPILLHNQHSHLNVASGMQESNMSHTLVSITGGALEGKYTEEFRAEVTLNKNV